MDPRLLLIPPLLIFEVWQLVISERYLGVKVIGSDVDPRTLGLREVTACIWVLGILASWAFMIMLLFVPYGRAQGVCMMVVSGGGFLIRRNCGLKWVLIVLTLEGALRIGMLVSVVGMYFYMMRGGSVYYR